MYRITLPDGGTELVPDFVVEAWKTNPPANIGDLNPVLVSDAAGPQPQPVLPGLEDPGVFYGEPVSPVTGPSPVLPVVGAGVVISLAWLIARLGTYVGTVVWWAIKAVGGKWANLPGWVQKILIGLGLIEGVDLLLDEGAGDLGLIPLPGAGVPTLPGGGSGVVTAGVVGSWRANGVRFYRLADGRIAVQNQKGRWKVWRPKRPIVIMPTGAANLNVLLRADALLNRQAKKLRTMLDRRAPRRAKAAIKVIETGPGSVHVVKG